MEPKIAESKANSRLGVPRSDQNARTWSQRADRLRERRLWFNVSQIDRGSRMNGRSRFNPLQAERIISLSLARFETATPCAPTVERDTSRFMFLGGPS
jgi:hypothetical protein